MNSLIIFLLKFIILMMVYLCLSGAISTMKLVTKRMLQNRVAEKNLATPSSEVPPGLEQPPAGEQPADHRSPPASATPPVPPEGGGTMPSSSATCTQWVHEAVQQVDDIQNDIIKHNIAAMQSIDDQLKSLNATVDGLNSKLEYLMLMLKKS